MKKFTKILSFITALSMSASLAAPVFADTLTVSVDGDDILGSTVNEEASSGTVDAAVQPEVLVFRDYEDVPATASRWQLAQELAFNQLGNFGTTTLGTNAGVGVDPVVVNGADGKGLRFDTRSSDGATTGGFASVTTNGYSTGKIYIAFDMQRKSDAELDEQDGTTDGYKMVTNAETGEEEKQYVIHDTYFYFNDGDGSTQRYGRIWTRHSKSTAGTWNGDTSGHYIPDENLHRYEYVVDLDNDTFKGYVDGAQVGNGTTYTADFLKFNMFLTNAIKYFDNFGIIHYPTGCENTFSLNAGEMNMSTGALTVDFDNDAATTVDTKTFKANYPAILTEDITPENVVVKNSKGEDVAVSAVNKNVAIGSYNVVLEEALADGETYTVSVDSDLVSALGAKIKGTTAEFKIVTPEIFLYRDYEDYTGSAWDAYIIRNSNKKWGTWEGGQNQPLRENSKAVEGPSGTAVNIGKPSGNPNANLPYAVDSGVFYFGVDVEKESDEFFDELDGTTNGLNADGKTITHENFITLGNSANHAMYARFGTGHSAAANCVSGWGGHDFVKVPNMTAGYHRYEIVADLDANKVTIYLDGVALGTSDYTHDITKITFQFDQGIAKWDNLAMVHYPQGVKPQTFSLQNAKADKEANTITVSLKSNTQGGTYKAPYNIYTEELTADDFVVMDVDGNFLEATSIEPGKVYGEYVITMEDALVENATYTVATSAERTDALGATLDSNAAAECYVHPDVYFDLGFDGYKGEQTKFYPYTFGTQKLTHQKAAYDEKYGTGLEIDDMSTSNWPLTEYGYGLKEIVNSGVLTASFDIKFNEDYTTKEQPEVSINNGMGKYGPNGTGVYYLMHMNTSTFKTYTNMDGWSATDVATHEANTWYHIDLVMDFDNRIFNAYIDGALVSSVAMPATMQAKSVKWLLHEDSVYDNLRLAHSESDSFVVTKTAWNGNYAEVLLSEGADTASLAMADDVVVTDKATGEVVEATVELAGRRVFISGLDKSKSYTVTLPENYKSVTGNTLVDTEAVIEAGTFNVTGVKVTADENGTELTADMIANLKAGDKVYAEVTYVNETGKDKTFVLFGAAYSAKRMTSANYAPVTALGSVTGEAKAYVEITVDNPAEFEAKAIAVESVATMKPLK